MASFAIYTSSTRWATACALSAVAIIALLAAVAVAEIPAHQAKQIDEAAPAMASAKAKQPRRVFVFLTPPHLMPKDSHKAYCIPGHPLVAAFEGKDFRLAEETFQFQSPYSRDRIRVLLSLDTTTTNMDVPWIHRDDNDFALAWVRTEGKGRIFYCAIGHRTEHYWNPTILAFYIADRLPINGRQFGYLLSLRAPNRGRSAGRPAGGFFG